MGRVDAFAGVTFPSPPAEPDVRVSTHPALHESQLDYVADPDAVLAQGVAMLLAR
jgi:hypothetical protein